MDKLEKLKQKYKHLIEDVEYSQLMVRGLNPNTPVSKAYVVNYMGNEPENQAEFLLNALVETNVCFMVEIDPYKLYEKIYHVTDRNDIIAIFKDDVLDCDLFSEIYGETFDQVSLLSYL